MARAVRFVLWDVKDTLLRVRRSVGQQYCEEAARLGLRLPAAEVQTAFGRAYRQHSARYPNYGTAQGLGAKAWWSGVVRDTFSQCGVGDQALLDTLARNLYQGFSGPQTWEVFSDSERALQSCVSLGLQQGVVSNFDKRLEVILHRCGLRPYFSFLVTSEEAGVAKPDPGIFRQALERCGVPAVNVAHVGDSYVNDYVTARSLGIRGYLLDRSRGQELPTVPAGHRLHSLDELPSVLVRDAD
ncbi:haloacid dehalogenase-like hydrolase domain-containing protein 3-like [Scleropages formosus]|uniref:Haloacid dehalogenase-like hydrolase domain-containing protein 3 n=1 Tax=Scleropages formosus TaxID=113540 RepID=A0A0P7WNC1_SCLFO|nr:haloacid dehalogenase-like hydrolase domain-containing protein 3-like [Scleropages formosus]